MTWREVLEKAAMVDPGVVSQVGPVTMAIEEGLAGAVSERALRAMDGGRGLDESGSLPLLDALDRAARGAGRSSWDADTLAAVRATLRELSTVHTALVQIHLGIRSTEDLTVKLESLARAAGPDRHTATAGPVCSRCGYSPVDMYREKALGDVWSLVHCPACGLQSQELLETHEERFPKF